MAESTITFKNINSIVYNESMWKKIDDTILKLKNIGIGADELKFCMAGILITVMFKSMQRPGALLNCTVEEFRRAKIEVLGFETTRLDVYSGSSMEIILKIYSILKISGKFNVRGSLRFQCRYAHGHNKK